MIFDVKDVKSWATRKDVKIGDKGYVANGISQFRELNFDDAKCGKVSYIDNNWNLCFKSDLDPFTCYAFFLPLKAVKKEKKYRPFESMAEFTKVVYDLVPNNLNITGVGESFTVRRKWNQHIEKVLITHLEYDANHNLISINGQSLKSLFENYEIITDEGKVIPFGVEMKND